VGRECRLPPDPGRTAPSIQPDLIYGRHSGPDRTYKNGEVITESTDVDHWAENTSSEPVTIISVDLFKE